MDDSIGWCRQKTSSALFFKYNSQLGPPYQVLIDTNFINFAIKNKVQCPGGYAMGPQPVTWKLTALVAVQLDLVQGMVDCLYAQCTPMITDCVMAELEKLGAKYRVALKVAKVRSLQSCLAQQSCNLCGPDLSLSSRTLACSGCRAATQAHMQMTACVSESSSTNATSWPPVTGTSGGGYARWACLLCKHAAAIHVAAADRAACRYLVCQSCTWHSIASPLNACPRLQWVERLGDDTSFSLLTHETVLQQMTSSPDVVSGSLVIMGVQHRAAQIPNARAIMSG